MELGERVDILQLGLFCVQPSLMIKALQDNGLSVLTQLFKGLSANLFGKFVFPLAPRVFGDLRRS